MLITSLSLAMVFSVLTPTRSYDDCTKVVAETPTLGLDYAESWQMQGGGASAKHCRAIALLALEKPGRAGDILLALAKEEENDPGIAARLYLQAAEAFAAGRRKEPAMSALQRAYALTETQPEVDMTAAAVYATLKEWKGTVLALHSLEKMTGLSGDALALRARANFELGELEAAAADVSAALHLDPYLVDAIVLRGDLLGRHQVIPNDPFGVTASD